MRNLIFITGGARSGKSAYAEDVARSRGVRVSYIATMPRISGDHDLARRIEKHVARRPPIWITIEAPSQLDHVVKKLSDTTDTCIIDCISLYVSNLLYLSAESSNEVINAGIKHDIEKLLSAIESRPEILFIVVSSEVGSGIVPENETARVYRDLLGEANQEFAKAASQAYLCCAGLVLELKNGFAGSR